MVPGVVLMKSGLVSINTARQNISKTAVLVNTARQVNVAHSKTTVNAARLMSYLSKITHSTVKRPIHKNTIFKNSNINQRVNTARDKKFNTTRPKAVVNAVKGNNFNAVKASACWVWKPKHKVLNHRNEIQFCEMKGILRQYSVARTPQQNGVAERRNMTLIEATRTMLADSKLPTTFWAEAVNTACYVQNRVLVVKPHNKTPYELFHGRTPTLSFMRPFGCPITILNTIDHLGKFDGKADEGFFVGYSLNSKAFKVFNSRTRIVEENLHIRFSKSTPNVVATNNVNAASTNEVNTVGGKTSIELPFDLNMPALEDYSIFDFSRDDEDDGAEADMNNLDTTIQEEPKKVIHALKDPSWIEAMQEELLQFQVSRGKTDKTLFIKRHKDKFYGRTYIILGIKSEKKKDGIFIS
ncbi:ribonuclease H-like domain-containing protein [Tanacetum coccineum]